MYVEGTNLLLSPATTPVSGNPWEKSRLLRNPAQSCAIAVMPFTVVGQFGIALATPLTTTVVVSVSSAATGKGVVDIVMGDISKLLNNSTSRDGRTRSAG
ncbi:hypothetical protein GE21DRAFT_1305829 [Neurospora crassa]|uniref:Uncharacterized protein B23D6.080 n=1 Tax=Neurospora crassa TaxID=5141 RepID=Q8X015_NEUCS|nr:hypothetical protein GE21DRAFT_1305829 [Neurospora crassa]CAD21160.1 hypothetical protein [Neurospora crassa]